MVEQLFNTMEGSTAPDFGYELREGSEWEDCFACHIGSDRYRVIWELLPAEEDFENAADEVVPILILRVGPKTDEFGRTIYEDGRPEG